MYKQDYTPRRRGFDEHAGYYQGCESAFTHVSACCSAGSPTSDQNYTCTKQESVYPAYESDVPLEPLELLEPPLPTSNQNCSAIEQANCIAGSPVPGKTSYKTIKYLGTLKTAAECAAACDKNSTATDPCRSYAFYYPDSPQEKYAGGCFGRHDTTFHPRTDIPLSENHVVSGVSCKYPPPISPTPAPKPRAKDQKGYDWFKSDPTNTTGVSTPDYSANHTNSATLIRDAAIDFLGRHKAATNNEMPFFLYLPFQNIHGPYTCELQYEEEYANNTHGLTAAERTIFGYLTEMDHMVGAIMAALKANGQYQNSVVIFSR
jgi:hypothetical protein